MVRLIPTIHIPAHSITRVCLLAAALSAFAPGCSRKGENPNAVVDGFLAAVQAADTAAAYRLVDWSAIIRVEDYVTDDYFANLVPAEKQKVLQTYRELFRTQYLPVMARAKFKLLKVAESRGDADARITVRFPAPGGGETPENDFTVSIKYNSDSQRWMIVNFGYLLRLCQLNGNFDPSRLYLQEPVK